MQRGLATLVRRGEGKLHEASGSCKAQKKDTGQGPRVLWNREHGPLAGHGKQGLWPFSLVAGLVPGCVGPPLKKMRKRERKKRSFWMMMI